MALPRLTFARIVSVREVNDRTFYDIAVQTEAGEIRPGEIEAGSYVFGDGLIFGAMVGDEFKPWRSRSRTATIIRARIDGSSNIGNGRFRYDWTEVEPGSTPGTYTARSRNSGSDGYLYNGMEVPNDGGVLGSGIRRVNIPQGFAPVPLADGAVVWIEGPFGDTEKWWDFSVSTHVDGSCGGAV